MTTYTISDTAWTELVLDGKTEGLFSNATETPVFLVFSTGEPSNIDPESTWDAQILPAAYVTSIGGFRELGMRAFVRLAATSFMATPRVSFSTGTIFDAATHQIRPIADGVNPAPDFTYPETNLAVSYDRLDHINVLTSEAFPNGTVFVSKVEGNEEQVGAEFVTPSGAKVFIRRDGRARFDPNGAFGALGIGETTLEPVAFTIQARGGATAETSLEVTINGPTS